MTEEICTELLMVPWPNEQAEKQPLTLLGAWQGYIHEHCRRKGQEVNRVVYTAKHWLRIMGIDATPDKWKRADISRYEDTRRAEGVSASTIHREMSIQRAALSHAMKWERIDRIPHFEKPPAESVKRRPLTEEEYRRLMASPMPRRVRMFFLVAYHTGHRARAIETLTWARVNFEARSIDFNEPGARKTTKRRVDGFPMPDELYRRLLSAKEYHDRLAPADPYVIGLGPRGKCSTSYHDCKAALRAVGIDELGLCRHTIRKTFVTERIKAGFNPEKVAALIADNPATMRRHYAILLTEDLRDTANMRAAA